MRRAIAIVLLIPALVFLWLSNLFDSKLSAEIFTKVFKEILDKAGLSLIEK